VILSDNAVTSITVASNTLSSSIYSETSRFIKAYGNFDLFSLSNENANSLTSNVIYDVYGATTVSIDNVTITSGSTSALSAEKATIENDLSLFRVNKTTTLTIFNVSITNSSLDYSGIMNVYDVSDVQITSLELNNISM
jgi:hypothetical protein